MDVRNTIIETASQLFYTQGYNKTGINEVIKEAGIAKATLYSHFKSKEDLCIAYLKYKDFNFRKNIAEYCNMKPKGYERILAMFDFLQDLFYDEDFNGCWCINTIAEIPRDNEDIQSEIRKQKNAHISFIANLIEENLDLSDQEYVDILSRRIYLLYESAVAESRLHKSTWPIQHMKKVCANLME